MMEEDLSKLNIIYGGGSLNLKRDYDDRMAVTSELDTDKTEHWSSDGMYRRLRLCVLQKLVPRTVSD
jgi:hypothetical protein